MLHFDRGLKITQLDLAIDVRRRQPRGFISHAHMDHMAAHELAFCTPATAQLYRMRFGPRRTREMNYRAPLDWNGLRLTTLPAGHVLGSAMLHVEGPAGAWLYTGDFRLGPSATAEPCEMRRADVLVMETTFGNPFYRLPPRDEVVGRLVDLTRSLIAAGKTPVIHAYVLGKSQEVTKILTSAGIPVLQHPVTYQISQAYEACGCSLGEVHLYPGRPLPGHAVIAPPRNQKVSYMPGLKGAVTIAVTGWANAGGSAARLGVDHALPLSDHADFDGLLAAVDQVRPKTIYCTHGPLSFVDELRRAGWNARPLDGHARALTA